MSEEKCCKHCGDMLEWEDCNHCSGDGFFDGYEEDPLWYNPGELVTCSNCGGHGGWLSCENSNCKPTDQKSFGNDTEISQTTKGD